MAQLVHDTDASLRMPAAVTTFAPDPFDQFRRLGCGREKRMVKPFTFNKFGWTWTPSIDSGFFLSISWSAAVDPDRANSKDLLYKVCQTATVDPEPDIRFATPTNMKDTAALLRKATDSTCVVFDAASLQDKQLAARTVDACIDTDPLIQVVFFARSSIWEDVLAQCESRHIDGDKCFEAYYATTTGKPWEWNLHGHRVTDM
jgi:hypothetical protein